MTDQRKALLPVTQADRDAAWPFISENSIAGTNREGFFNGGYDGAPIVQAFARHRQSHSLPGDVVSKFARVAANIPDDVDDDRTVCIEMPYKQEERITGPLGETPLALVISLDGLTIGDFRALAALTPSALSGDAGEGE